MVSDDLVDIAVFQDPGIERITLACDTVVEGNDTLLEALYHRQIRMAAAQLQDIDGKAANVNDIGDGMSFQRAELGNGSRKRLGIAEYLADPDRVVLSVILKIHDLASAQEVLLETAVQLLIVCGRQTHKQVNVNGIECLGHLAALQLLGDGKEGEDIETLILRLIAEIGDALLCQRIVLVVPADVVRFEALEPIGYNQARSEQRVGSLNRLIAVIDRNNHGNLPPYPVKQGEARSPA